MSEYVDLKYITKNMVHTKAALINETKAAFVQSKDNKVSQLHIGDIIKGKLMRQSDLSFILALKDGTTIPVKIDKNMHLAQLLSFKVMDIVDGTVTLSPLEQESSLVNKVIEAHQLPQNKLMEDCIDAFIQKELPLDRTMLLKSYILQKEINVPSPVIMNLIENMGDEAKQLLTQMQNHKPNQFQGVMEQFRAILDSVKMSNTEMSNDSQVMWTETLLSIATEDDIAKVWQQLDYKIPLSLFLEKVENRDLFNEKLFNTIFTLERNQVEEKASVGLSKRELPLYDGYEKLTKCLDVIEHMISDKETLDRFHTLQESVQQGHKLETHGHFFTYPYNANNHIQEAKVYFYKPHKKKSINQRDFYAVIALDMPSIDHIEIHIHQMEKDLLIDVVVAHPPIKTLIDRHFYELQEKIIPLGYNVKGWKCRLKENREDKEGEKTSPQINSLDFKV